MPLILRSVKGSKLTISEMDGNLLYLQSLSKFTGNTSGNPIMDLYADGDVHANAFYGDGSNLTGVAAGFTGNTSGNPIMDLYANGDVHANAFYGDGSNLTGITGGTANPGGNNTEVQYNDNGSFGGSSGFTFDTNSEVLTATYFQGDGSLLTNIPGASSVVTKTKAEIDLMISNDELVVGQEYVITGVDTGLYGGTDIFLKAVATNLLSSQGKGLFYNPKYKAGSPGNGVWTRYFKQPAYNYSNPFYLGEIVKTDNDAYGIYVAGDFIEWLGGDWSAASNMTGFDSGESADVYGGVVPSYSSGQSVIWGGKKWVLTATGNTSQTVEIGIGNGSNNYFEWTITGGTIIPGTFTVTDGLETFTESMNGSLAGDLGGNGYIDYINGYFYVYFNSNVTSSTPVNTSYQQPQIGYAIDRYNLSENWSVVSFNSNDYNLVVDEIQYDYENDKIIGRKDKYGNEVYCSFVNIIDYEHYDNKNPIKDFQWGNQVKNYGFIEGQTRYNFSDEDDGDNGIEDGGADMYDGANQLSANGGSTIPYTHTRLPYDIYEGWPDGAYPMNGSIQDGSSYFNGSAQYFTNMYPGMFVMMAEGISIDSFKIDGNIGADGSGTIETDSYDLTGYSQTYGVFVKKQYDSNGDPSINHIMIVNTPIEGIIHDWDTGSSDDFDQISNLTGATWLSCMVVSEWSDGTENNYIEKSVIDQIIVSFIELVDGKNLIDSLLTLNSGYESITSNMPSPKIQQKYGLFGNRVYESYMGCLNFTGGKLLNNTLSEKSVFEENIFIPDVESSFSYNNLSSESQISNNKFSISSIVEYNNLSYSSFDNNTLGSIDGGNDTSEISNISIIVSSSLQNLNLMGSFVGGGSVKVNSSIYNSYLENSYVAHFDIAINSHLENNNIYYSYINNFEIKIESSLSYNYIIYSQFYENEIKNSSSFYSNLIGGSSIYHNKIDINSHMDSNEINNSSVYNNSIQNQGDVNANTMSYCDFEYNKVSEHSNINNNQFNNSFFGHNIIAEQSSIGGNNIYDNSALGGNSVTQNSNIQNNEVWSNSSIENNSLDRSCSINSNSIHNFSYLYYNNLYVSSTINNNAFSDYSEIHQNSINTISTLNGNTFTGTYLHSNIISCDSYINDNNSNNTNVYSNRLNNNSSIYENNFSAYSNLSYNQIESESTINNNNLTGSTITYNKIDQESNIRNTIFESSILEKNRLHYSDFWFQAGYPSSQNIRKVDVKDLQGNIDLTSASVIFQDYQKNIFTNSAGVARLSYYDASDLLVITDINA